MAASNSLYLQYGTRRKTDRVERRREDGSSLGSKTRPQYLSIAVATDHSGYRPEYLPTAVFTDRSLYYRPQSPSTAVFTDRSFYPMQSLPTAKPLLPATMRRPDTCRCAQSCFDRSTEEARLRHVSVRKRRAVSITLQTKHAEPTIVSRAASATQMHPTPYIKTPVSWRPSHVCPQTPHKMKNKDVLETFLIKCYEYSYYLEPA